MTTPATTAYPKRPAFFAHKFVRLMFLARTAGEIGPDAALMLVNIVHTEDAKHYSAPVRFYSQDLADQCGLSVSTLERARAKAVEAGWLNYTAGAKRRPAIYWVTIPDHCNDIPDGPTAYHSDDILRQADGESGENPGSMRGESGERVTDHLPSSLSLTPNPLPPASPASGESGTNPAKKSKPKNDPEADPRFVQFWQAYPLKVKKPDAAKAFAKVNPPPELLTAMLAAIEVQKGSRKWVDGYTPNPTTWLNNRGWEDELPAACGRSSPGVGPKQTTKTITSSDLDPDLYGLPAGGGR